MGNIYIPPKTIIKCFNNWTRTSHRNSLIIFENFNARHPTWHHDIKDPLEIESLADLISRHNVEIHNDEINTFNHPDCSSITDLILTRNISNIKCQTKNLNVHLSQGNRK